MVKRSLPQLVPPSLKNLISNVYHFAHLSPSEAHLLSRNKKLANSARGRTCTIIGSGIASSSQLHNDIISLNDAYRNYTFSPSLLKYVIHLDSARYHVDSDKQYSMLYDGCPTSAHFLTTIYNYRLTTLPLPRHFFCHPQQYISQIDMPSVFNNHLRPHSYYSRRYNITDFSSVLLHPVNVLGLALSWAIYLGYSTIILDGCQCNWSAHHTTQDYIGVKSKFYSNTNLLNETHYDLGRQTSQQCYPLRGRLDEWSSNYTLIDYSRHTLFYLYLLSRLGHSSDTQILSNSPESFLQDIFTHA